MTENDPPTEPAASPAGPTPTRWERVRARRPRGRAAAWLVGIGGFVLGLVVAGILLLATPLGGHGGPGPGDRAVAGQGRDGGPGRGGPDGGPGRGGPERGGAERGGPGRGGAAADGGRGPVIQVQPGGTVIVQPGATVQQQAAPGGAAVPAPAAPAVPAPAAPAAPAAPTAPAAPAAPTPTG